MSQRCPAVVQTAIEKQKRATITRNPLILLVELSGIERAGPLR